MGFTNIATSQVIFDVRVDRRVVNVVVEMIVDIPRVALRLLESARCLLARLTCRVLVGYSQCRGHWGHPAALSATRQAGARTATKRRLLRRWHSVQPHAAFLRFRS